MLCATWWTHRTQREKCHCYTQVAPHSSAPAWKIPWTEEPGRLQSMGSLRVGHDGEISLSLFTCMHWRRKWQPTPVFLPGESQGWESLMGCHLWGRTESDTTEVTQQHSSLVGFPGGSAVKNLPVSAEDTGSIPRSGRSPGEESGNPLQYSCLGNPMERGAWWATAHGVTKESDTT